MYHLPLSKVSSIKKKIVIMFGLLLITMVIVVAIFEYLLNHGKFTHYIEQQINGNIDGEIEIGTIFLDMFSGVVLKDVSFSITNEAENFNFACKSLTINSGITSLFNLRIKKIEMEGMHFSVNFEDVASSGFDIFNNELDSFSVLNDLPIPDKLYVDIFSINNISGQISTVDYVIDLSEINLQIKELQILKPISLSLNGDIQLFNRSDVEFPIMSGKMGFNANYSLKKDLDEINIITNINFSDIKFSTPDYDYFAEGINGDIKLDLKTNYDFKKIFCKLNGKFDPFLVSIGTFSTDMRDNVTEILFEGIFDTDQKLLSGVNGTLFHEKIGSFNLKGSLADVMVNPQIDLTLKIKDLSYSNFFETFIKDTIEFSYPKFYNATIAGTSNASFDLFGGMDSLQINGDIMVEDGYVKVDDTFIDGLFMDFPISIKYPKSDVSVKKNDILEDYGTIKIDKISHPHLEIDGFEVNPLIESNNFFIKEPIEIPIFGGEFLVKDIFIEDLINLDRKVNFSFKFSDIDIGKVSAAANLTPFNGTLDTSLITFKQKDDRLFSDGEIKFSIFGGDVIINNLILTDFMSSLMGFEFSAKVNHLDLGKMSDTFQEWGNVAGIVNGEVNNFMIVAGEPYSFEIELKTEKERGVKQVVSANFLNSFVPGIGSALDTFGFTDYNYEVIGLQAKLENDYITFKGAIRDNGKELFMKGSGLKKLNIVFSNVDKNIKFSRFLSSFDSIMGANFEATKIESE